MTLRSQRAASAFVPALFSRAQTASRRFSTLHAECVRYLACHSAMPA